MYSLHDVVHLQVKNEASVLHRASEQIAAVQGCGAIKSTLEVCQDTGEECKLSRALSAFHQHNSWQCSHRAQSIPVDKECLQYTLGIMELPIQESPELDLMFGMGLPASDARYSRYYSRSFQQ